MPLDKSGSKQAFSRNVSEMMKAGHPQKQALAAAYNIQAKARHGRSKKIVESHPGYKKRG